MFHLNPWPKLTASLKLLVGLQVLAFIWPASHGLPR